MHVLLRCARLVQTAAASGSTCSLPIVKFDLNIPFLLARLFFGRRETAFFAAAELTMGNQTFEQELGCGHSARRLVGDFYLKRRKLLKEPLNLSEVRQCRRAWLVVVELDGPAQIEPLL